VSRDNNWQRPATRASWHHAPACHRAERGARLPVDGPDSVGGGSGFRRLW